MVNSIWLNSGKRGATENPLLRPREGSESRASEPPPPERGGHGLGSAMVQGSEGRGHANQDDRWTRRRDKSAAPARHSRSQDTTGARPPPSPWPAVPLAEAKERREPRSREALERRPKIKLIQDGKMCVRVRLPQANTLQANLAISPKKAN